MDAYGCRRRRVKRALRRISRKTNAIIIWRAGTRVLVTWCPATSHRETPSKCAMKDAASGRTGKVCTWTSRMPFSASAWKRFAINTEIYSIFMSGSRERTRTPCRCGSIPLLITRWVDYHLMSTIPGLFAGGEANLSDHGANRLGASALMQGLADGYFVLPCTVPDYIASTPPEPVDVSHPAFAESMAEVKNRFKTLVAVKGKRSPDSFHRELGRIMWDNCGIARSDADLRKALARIPELREEFWHNLRIVGGDDEMNQALEKANRVADFLELAELMCIDALQRTESCGGHFRVESQTEEGEAKRDDANFSYTAAWEWKGPGKAPALHKEPLTFEYVPLSQRSYK